MSDINQYSGAFLSGAQVQTDDIADGLVTAAKLGNDVSSLTTVDDVTIELVTDTLQVKDGGIGLTQLSEDVAPSHIVVFAGQPTTVGGAAAEAFTVTGVTATDLAFVQIVDNGTANVTALQAVCTSNTLTVTFSGNPGADVVFNYQILRATS